jgi:hypothetical protein
MIGKWFKRKDHPPSRPDLKWPGLPEAGFLLSRSARVGDVDRGVAIFSQKADDGLSAEPYPIAIPQYAIWRDEAGMETPVFVVQAERHITDDNSEPIFGLRRFDGEAIVATGSEVRLLGTAIPNQ